MACIAIYYKQQKPKMREPWGRGGTGREGSKAQLRKQNIQIEQDMHIGSPGIAAGFGRQDLDFLWRPPFVSRHHRHGSPLDGLDELHEIIRAHSFLHGVVMYIYTELVSARALS